MSVYSGFGTRTQEKNYNALVEYCLTSLVSNIMSSPALFENGFVFNRSFSKKIHRAYHLMKNLEENKYMKPHYTKALEPMINYLVAQHDFNTLQNDAESLRSKCSFVFPSTEGNTVAQSENFNPKVGVTLTPNKIERIKKFYSGNSIDTGKANKLQIKNVDVEYYGSKARSSSRQTKRAKRLDVSQKK